VGEGWSGRVSGGSFFKIFFQSSPRHPGRDVRRCVVFVAGVGLGDHMVGLLGPGTFPQLFLDADDVVASEGEVPGVEFLLALLG